MTAISKASAKAYFQTGDKPTQAEFGDLIDSYQDASSILQAISTVAATAVGIVRVLGPATASFVSADTFGLMLLNTASTGAAANLLNVGASTTASTTDVGVIEIATTAEATAGTDTQRAITPAALNATAFKQGTHLIPLPWNAWSARSSNGATPVMVNWPSNNITRWGWSFSASTDQAIQCTLPMPETWDLSTVTMRADVAASGTGNVVVGIRAVAFGNGDSLDAAFGTGQQVTANIASGNTLTLTAITGAMTVGGTPANRDHVVFEFYRDADNGGDANADTLTVYDIRIYAGFNAARDA